ncbi:MAG: hypothetical protein EOM64_05075 [Erysipelotrichia bacterium]|nr:hypothetical protein [Erysipelotrichia bacterium]
MELYKRYIKVVAVYGKTGDVQPLYFYWDDGKRYRIDRILSRERRASQVGGCGIRYVCMIQGSQRSLFLEQEKNRWFIESYQP